MPDCDLTRAIEIKNLGSIGRVCYGCELHDIVKTLYALQVELAQPSKLYGSLRLDRIKFVCYQLRLANILIE